MKFPISEIKHRMTRRHSDWDYTQRAIYMITVTLADRSREWLGKLILAENGEAQNCAMNRPSPIKGAIGNQKPILPQHYATNSASHRNGTAKINGAAFKACKPHLGISPVASHSSATIAPTKFGRAALEALEEMELLYPQVKIIESQLMPEHMHFVIYVHEKLDKPLSALIRGFKAGATKRWKILAENGEAQHRATEGAPHNNGTFIAKCDALKACNPNSGISSVAAHSRATEGATPTYGTFIAECDAMKACNPNPGTDAVAAHSRAMEGATPTYGTFIAKCDALKACNPNPGTDAVAAHSRATEGATPTYGTFIAKCDALKACNPNSGISSVAAHFCAAHIPQWAESFNDTILFHDGQLAAMINYVRDNPRRLAEKRANPELFSRVANLSLPLDGGRIIGQFEALGNRHLLDLPLVQVQCSRRYFAYRRIPKAGGGMKIAKNAAGEPIIEKSSPEYESRLEAVLAAASHGAVVLSPCISDGEKQIAREALKRNMRLVVLKNMGFAKCEKPAGRLFEACANGQLLMLAPAAWPHSTQAKAMTRFDATALNRIAQWLAGDDAVEVNYHGMQPANIDKLAEESIMAQR